MFFGQIVKCKWDYTGIKKTLITIFSLFVLGSVSLVDQGFCTILMTSFWFPLLFIHLGMETSSVCVLLHLHQYADMSYVLYDITMYVRTVIYGLQRL